MFKRMSMAVVLALLITSVLTACGRAPAPVTLSQLPVFTGATESTNAARVRLLGSVLALQLQTDSTIKSTEGKVYDVPAGTPWDAVKSFYSTALEKAGWTLAKTTDANTSYLGSRAVMGYTRGNQVVNVAYADDLIVILTEAK